MKLSTQTRLTSFVPRAGKWGSRCLVVLDSLARRHASPQASESWTFQRDGVARRRNSPYYPKKMYDENHLLLEGNMETNLKNTLL